MLSFKRQHEDTTEIYKNELLKVPPQNPEQECFWFPTPEELGDPTTYTPIQQRIYNEILKQKELEELNSQDDENSRKYFLSNFDWSDITLSPDERQHVGELLIDMHAIFAGHRFSIGTNREFKLNLTPNDDRPAYSQGLPTPINLKDDISVEVALLHNYVIITTLPFSKNASPILAQRKPNGRLQFLVDLRKINNLITEDYIKNNFPVSTLSDAAQHIAGKNFFASQIPPTLTIVCKWQITNPNKCLPPTLRAEHLLIVDKAIKVDQCAQYVDGIAIAANNTKQLCANIRTVFECIRNARLKLTCRLAGPYNYTTWHCSSSRQSRNLLVKTEIPQI